MAQTSLNSTGVASSGSLVLQTNGTTAAVTVDTAQNVGVGVTPSAWQSSFKAFQVSTVASFAADSSTLYNSTNAYYNAGWKYIGTGYATNYYQDSGSGAHVWRTAASGTAGNAITFTQAMTLDASGRLGIGVSSPSAPLHVAGTSLIAGANTQLVSGELDSGTTYIQSKNSGGTAKALAFYGSSEYGRFDSSGNLLVKTTSQGGASVLTVKSSGSTASGNGIAIVKSDTTDYWSQNVDSAVGYTWGKNGSDFWYAGRSGSNNCVSNNGSWVNSSDLRLKENIVPLSGALEKVCQLQGVSFDRIIGGHHEIGLIAQEVERIYPEAVEAPVSETDHYALNYGALIALLIEAIKEQQAIINAQATVLEQLKADVAALKA